MDIDTLFIIKSPFQALCAYEAINDFDLNRRYYVILLKDDVNREMASDFLRSKGVSFVEYNESSGSKEFFVNFKSIKGCFKTCFVGNYYSLNMYKFSLFLLKKGGRIKYLDDGTATLSMFLSNPFPRYYMKKDYLRKQKLRIDYFLLDIKRYCYGIKQSLYTIYNLKSSRWDVELNKMKTLKSFSESKQGGVFIIGTRSSYHFERKEYIRLLEDTIHYALSKCPGQPVCYCPHRADGYLYNDFFQEQGMTVFNTQVSVEIDFITRNINPMMIVGYGSTALLTLKMMYPAAIVTSVEIETKAQSIHKGYKELNEQIISYYHLSGIEIIDSRDLLSCH
jgi:hypothetical protein